MVAKFAWREVSGRLCQPIPAWHAAIAEGTDHLLFLLALLLPAPLLVFGSRWAGFAGARHSFLHILKVVTAFTAGHSITLA
jgi:hypothetical protein